MTATVDERLKALMLTDLPVISYLCDWLRNYVLMLRMSD